MLGVCSYRVLCLMFGFAFVFCGCVLLEMVLLIVLDLSSFDFRLLILRFWIGSFILGVCFVLLLCVVFVRNLNCCFSCVVLLLCLLHVLPLFAGLLTLCLLYLLL